MLLLRGFFLLTMEKEIGIPFERLTVDVLFWVANCLKIIIIIIVIIKAT